MGFHTDSTGATQEKRSERASQIAQVIRLFANDSWARLASLHRFAARRRTLCRDQIGVASDEERQHCADARGDGCQHEGIVQAHHKGVLSNVHLRCGANAGLHCGAVTELRDALGRSRSYRSRKEGFRDSGHMVCRLLRQIGVENRDANSASHLAGDIHQRRSAGHCAVTDDGQYQRLKRDIGEAQTQAAQDQPPLQVCAGRTHRKLRQPNGAKRHQREANGRQPAWTDAIIEAPGEYRCEGSREALGDEDFAGGERREILHALEEER